MTFKLACGDVMPGCNARFENTDKDALLGEVAEHAASVHQLRENPPVVRSAVESKIVGVG